MPKFCFRLAVLCCLFFYAHPSYSQVTHKVSVYLSGQYTGTLYDITEGNNPWGLGVGVQGFFNNRHAIKPMVDITADAYPYDDKVLRGIYNAQTGDFKETADVNGMVNVFAGLAVQPVKPLYLSFTTGPSFINGNVYLGIKPSAGVYVDKKQLFSLRFSYINIFNRDRPTTTDFGSYSIAIGVKLL